MPSRNESGAPSRSKKPRICKRCKAERGFEHRLNSYNKDDSCGIWATKGTRRLRAIPHTAIKDRASSRAVAATPGRPPSYKQALASLLSELIPYQKPADPELVIHMIREAVMETLGVDPTSAVARGPKADRGITRARQVFAAVAAIGCKIKQLHIVAPIGVHPANTSVWIRGLRMQLADSTLRKTLEQVAARVAARLQGELKPA